MSEELQREPTAPRKIQELSDRLISQIAAGEVIERPASVVKELVENSLDAGATDIEVRLEEGGIKRIVVADNGCGIPKEDLPLALKRHATSKIRTLTDLESVASFGFRGEALASIDSVADVTITSRTAEAEEAWAISRDGIVPAAGQKGTRIEVKDLFYLTPARRKFLKSPATETAHILTQIERMALANPSVRFRVFTNGRASLHLSAQPTAERVFAVMPEEFKDACRPISADAPGLHLDGWVGLPTAARSRADKQFFFVNGRFIRDRVLQHAVKTAYADVLHVQAQPMFVLSLSINPSRVDVNVHPQKSEVRFRDGQLVHSFVSSAIMRAIAHGAGEQAPVSLPGSHPVEPMSVSQSLEIPAQRPVSGSYVSSRSFERSSVSNNTPKPLTEQQWLNLYGGSHTSPFSKGSNPSPSAEPSKPVFADLLTQAVAHNQPLGATYCANRGNICAS